MLEPLPYRGPNNLVAVWETNRGGTARNVIAPANSVAWRERTRTRGLFGARRQPALWRAYTVDVIGVMPAGFTVVDRKPSSWFHTARHARIAIHVT